MIETLMECFIKKIWYGSLDDSVHRQFIRFGKGKYEGRAVLNLQKSVKIKLRGSFEWTNDFVKIICELDKNAKFSGVVFSKEELSEFGKGKKKQETREYEVSDLSSQEIEKIKDKVYVMLLDATAREMILKIKKRLPKPGKSGEAKIDDKFCQLEADLKYWNEIKEAFMLPECKKARISHIYIIEEIILPKGETKPEKIREMAKRKGKIIRKIESDKQSKQEEKSFEV